MTGVQELKWNDPLQGAMIIAAVLLVTGFWPWPSHAESRVEFNRDVRPSSLINVSRVTGQTKRPAKKTFDSI